MTTKTFSRARAAKAALVKLLTDNHEVPADHMQITTVELADGRHTAKVDFLVAQPPFVLMDLLEQGWAFTDPDAKLNNGVLSWVASAEVVAAAKADLSAILDMGEAGDATPYPAPLPPTDEELAAIGVVPAEGVAPKATGYIAEASTAEGPTKRVWAIADSMPGAKRKDVIEACRLAGIAFGTARTQYQKWFSSKKN